jgi:hypothetical protein
MIDPDNPPECESPVCDNLAMGFCEECRTPDKHV